MHAMRNLSFVRVIFCNPRCNHNYTFGINAVYKWVFKTMATMHASSYPISPYEARSILGMPTPRLHDLIHKYLLVV